MTSEAEPHQQRVPRREPGNELYRWRKCKVALIAPREEVRRSCGGSGRVEKKICATACTRRRDTVRYATTTPLSGPCIANPDFSKLLLAIGAPACVEGAHVSMDYYAHSLKDEPPERWEPLYTGDGGGHLEKVAKLAEEVAGKFGAGEWGRVAGLWHDLGKYQSEFQDYLENKHPGVEHAGAGAALAQSRKVRDAVALCFAIAGHHAGLANAQSNESAGSLGEVSLLTPLVERLRRNQPVLERLRSVLPAEICDLRLPDTPLLLSGREHEELKSSPKRAGGTELQTILHRQH